MEILGILGSPRQNGNTARLLSEVVDAARRKGHEAEVFNVASMDIKGCVACEQCKTGRVQYCAIDDDMQKIYPALVGADALILATPVYMAQVSGQMKKFLDRWYAFLDKDHEVRMIGGKKFITITTSGAPCSSFGASASISRSRFDFSS